MCNSCHILQETFSHTRSLLLSISDFLYFYCTPQGWKYRRAAKIVHEQAERIINERRQSLGLNVNINIQCSILNLTILFFVG